MVAAMLTNLGYAVKTFGHSEQAFAAYLESPDQYDVIITDQTMPNLKGAELAAGYLPV